MKTYYPELKEKAPQCEIIAETLYNKIKVTTPMELKGMGIEFRYIHPDNEKMNVYYVTMNAFTKLKSKYAVVMKVYFD